MYICDLVEKHHFSIVRKQDPVDTFSHWGVDTQYRQIILYNVHTDDTTTVEAYLRNADQQYGDIPYNN